MKRKKFEYSKIENDDLIAIENMAKKYGITSKMFCSVVAAGETKPRQFRVTEEEYELIAKKAKKANASLGEYCEQAIRRGLDAVKNGADHEVTKEYGAYRSGKRISVVFRDKDIERDLVEYTSTYRISLGTTMRYFALEY